MENIPMDEDVELAIKASVTKLRDLNALKINIASISDIHTNHPNTPTEMILRNLMMYAFPDDEATRSLDIIFIAGDFTDSLMDMSSENAVKIRKWVAGFVKFCKKHNIMVRVLEGTRLHDWGQSIMFVEENENHNIGCDLKYFKDIAIEHIDKFDIDVLYIPDEIRPTTDITLRDVRRLMKERGLEKVDIAIMHGQFAYQLPEIAYVAERVHDKKAYEDIVRHFIFVGHIHQHKPNGKVIPHGSFDRLAQGEEDPKGHVRVINGKMSFIENRGAMKYFKVDAVGKDLNDIIPAIRREIGESTDKFKVQLLANRGDVAFELVKRLSQAFPTGVFDVQNVEKQKKRKERQQARSLKSDALPKLTRGNLLIELSNELRARDPSIAEECIDLAERIINVTN